MDRTKSVSQNKPSLFLSQLSQILCYSNGKQTNIYIAYMCRDIGDSRALAWPEQGSGLDLHHQKKASKRESIYNIYKTDGKPPPANGL